MVRKPVAADWELIVERDLESQLLPAGHSHVVYSPVDVAWLPERAYEDIFEATGRIVPEGLLVVPAAVWRIGRWWRRHRCLYSPRCVLGIGECGVALWVQALPAPGVRVQIPLSEIVAVEQHGSGPRRLLVVTGQAARLPVRYHAAGQAAVDIWTQPLRMRAAAG